MVSIEFNTSNYQMAHGHAPRGRGSWAFGVAGQTRWAKDPVTGATSMTYGEAKKQIASEIRQELKGVHTLSVWVEVLS